MKRNDKIITTEYDSEYKQVVIQIRSLVPHLKNKRLSPETIEQLINRIEILKGRKVELETLIREEKNKSSDPNTKDQDFIKDGYYNAALELALKNPILQLMKANFVIDKELTKEYTDKVHKLLEYSKQNKRHKDILK